MPTIPAAPQRRMESFLADGLQSAGIGHGRSRPICDVMVCIAATVLENTVAAVGIEIPLGTRPT